MKQFSQGVYTVQNPLKYAGQNVPYFRSSWELAFMRMCDQHPNILKWANESVMIQYVDKNGSTHVELVEIKPKNQTTLESAKTAKNQAATIVNSAKWAAAQEWCLRKGIRFKVINEDQIFHTNKKRTPRTRVSKKKK